MNKANMAQKMKTATIQIPKRLEEGILPIKHWIEAYTESVGQPLTVALGTQEDPGEIWIAEADNLNQAAIVALQNALDKMNDRLNRSNDTWKAKSDEEIALRASLLEIDKIFSNCQREQ